MATVADDRRQLGWLFNQGEPVADLPAEEYRRLARVTGQDALEETHGPRGDRKATVALAYALCAVSASAEEVGHG